MSTLVEAVEVNPEKRWKDRDAFSKIMGATPTRAFVIRALHELSDLHEFSQATFLMYL